MRTSNPFCRIHGKVNPCLVGIQLASADLEVGVDFRLAHSEQRLAVVEEGVDCLRNLLAGCAEIDVPLV